jgi:all-trans-retinol 13,14-reductase
MDNLDVLIIGSGPGALAAAICLSKAGKKVLVLEQHYVPGGWCHSFHLKGQRFSPGVHYIGLVDKGGMSANLFEGLGIANELVFFRLNEKGYEHCWIGKDIVDMPAHADKLYETLSQKFPNEKENLKKYLDLVYKISKQLELLPTLKGLTFLTIPFRMRHLLKYGFFSLKSVIDKFIKDPLLKDVLNIQCGDHALAPAKASFLLQCAMMGHYKEGGFYPIGGGGGLIKAMTNAVKKHGGEVKVEKRVVKILTEGNNKKKAIGVELENGEQIKATYVISNADPDKTFHEMVGTQNLSNKLKTKLEKTTYSVSSLIMFITIDDDVTKYGVDSGNIWMTQDIDIDKQYAKISKVDLMSDDEFPALFISCSTLKDPQSYNGRYHNFEIITFIDHELFKMFSGRDNYHTEKYNHYKQRACEKFLKSLEKVIPGVRNKIIQMELGTPKTNEFYINCTKANVYGTEKNLKQLLFPYQIKTEIKNLYMCGASTTSHGATGAAISGVMTAASILNTSVEELMKTDGNQNIRIYDAEDSSQWPSWIFQKIKDKKNRFKEVSVESPVGKFNDPVPNRANVL